jgi:Polyketide cyclase / dehydrase and lipid transport
MPMRQALRRYARLFAASTLVASLSCHSQPVTVRVERQGDEIVIDVEAKVQVPVKQAWAVLTDYANMASFVSALKSSSIVQQRGNSLQVAQAGEQHHGPFSFAFNTVRAVELVPDKEVRSRLVKGSFKSYEATTRLVSQGATTLIVHHGRYVPDTWVPPFIGPTVIRDKAAEQYAELITEMLKRYSASAAKLGDVPPLAKAGR